MKTLTKIILSSLIISIIISCFGYLLYQKTEYSEQYQHNIDALHDTIEYYSSQNEQLIAKKSIFQTEIDDLGAYNKQLEQQISELNIKNKILSAVNISGSIDNGVKDTTIIVKTDTILLDINENFQFNDEWRTLEGQINIKNNRLNLKIDKDINYFDYTLAVADDGNIYMSSKNPYIRYNNITGMIVPRQHKTNFSIGPVIGAGYGVIHNKFDIYLGVAVTWKIFNF